MSRKSAEHSDVTRTSPDNEAGQVAVEMALVVAFVSVALVIVLAASAQTWISSLLGLIDAGIPT